MLRDGLKKPVVWHLHGHIDDVANLILTPDGYSHLYPGKGGAAKRYNAALTTLRQQLASYSFLFVGFSLNDAHVSAQLQHVERLYQGSTGPHYVLMHVNEAQRLARDRYPGIEVLEYADHGGPLLDWLRQMIKEINSSGDVSEGDTAVTKDAPRRNAKKAGPRPRHRQPISPLVTNSGRADALADAAPSADPSASEDFSGAREAIRSAFEQVKEHRIRDERGKEVGVRERTAQVLHVDQSSADDLSVRLADHLTRRHDDNDIANLFKVFQDLKLQRQQEAADLIAKIANWLMPLCLDPRHRRDARGQGNPNEIVLLRTDVKGTIVVELLAAGLAQKEANLVFDPNTNEVRGLLSLDVYQAIPIGDPDAPQEPMLRELYLSTHYSKVKPDERGNFKIPPDVSIREELLGHLRGKLAIHNRPRYCVVPLPERESDVKNLILFLENLQIPHLLFIGIRPNPDKKSIEMNSFLKEILNLRFTHQDASNLS